MRADVVSSAAREPALTRYRWAVASRVVAAVGGGYAVSAACAAALGLVAHRAGMTRADAVTLSTMLSFVVYAVAVLWVFACATATRAWLGLAVPAAVLLATVWWLYGGRP